MKQREAMQGMPRTAGRQWLIIQGLLDGADFAPLGAVTVAPRRPEPQQPQPAGCLRRA